MFLSFTLYENSLDSSFVCSHSQEFCPIITLFEKSNFCPKIQFRQNPNIFTSFSPKFFLTIFFVKSKLSTAKKSKITTFSRVFPKKSTVFWEIKVEFLDKK